MPPKSFVISNHAKKRFLERMGDRRRSNIDKKGIEKTIKKELTIERIRYIIDIDAHKYVFMKNGKEYRFLNKGNYWVLLTIVRHSRTRYKSRINSLRRIKNYPPIQFKI